jgi:AmmeMemoRadiSam system protein B
MSQRLPRLRTNLEFMPSPVPDRPGLLIRDSFQYSDATLIIPPLLVECLQCFDGKGTDLDLRQVLVSLTGDLRVGDLEQHLLSSLRQAGFLEDEVYARLKEEKHRAFAASPLRTASHAGSAYPAEAEALGVRLAECVNHDAAVVENGNLVGIAAPHVSLEGGCECYRAAYGALGPAQRNRTFVILGTSHYGQPERFGLTRKPFATPLGQAVTEVALVDELNRKGGAVVVMEDYCHAVEHSIEFQVIFLQHLCGPAVRILPILCGSYAHSLHAGGRPEEDEAVGRFLGALAELARREEGRLFWILGVDMAHIGRRYGDPFAVQAMRGEMATVAGSDRSRLERVTAGDARGFWAEVQAEPDNLRWCGASAIYTFLKAVPEAKGELLRYGQWNIDAHSAVSFAAIAFRKHSGHSETQENLEP